MKVLPPVMVSFSVTRECNLKCIHCYSRSVETPHPDELTTAGILEVPAELLPRYPRSEIVLKLANVAGELTVQRA